MGKKKSHGSYMVENYAATKKNKACLNEWTKIKATKYYTEKSRTKKYI